MKNVKKNYCYLFTSRNNYRIFEDVVFTKSNPRLLEEEIYNIDVESDDEQREFGKKIIKKYNMTSIKLEKSPIPVQNCIDGTIKYLDKTNNKKDWIIWLQHDSFIADDSYYENLDSELTNKFYIDNVGTIGTAVDHEGMGTIYGRVNLCKDSMLHPNRGWYQNLPNDYLYVNNFVVESTMYTWIAINIKLWKKYIVPDDRFKLLYCFDDVSHQFMLKKIPSICIPKLKTSHQTIKKYGTSTGKSPKFYPEFADSTHCPQQEWNAKWGWPWGLRNKFNVNLREVFDEKRFINTLQEKLFNMFILNGPIELNNTDDLKKLKSKMKILEALKNTKTFVHYTEQPSFGKSCAIVGNSGALLEQEYGDLIDSHDSVIRFNNAKIEGFEKHVGSKTTHRIMNCHSILNINNEEYYKQQKARFPDLNRNALFEFENENLIFKTNPNWKLWELANVLDPVKKKNNTCFIDEHFYDFGLRLLGKEPTNGLLGLLLALKYCTDITCFGFTFHQDSWDKKHYYEKINPYNLDAGHDFKKEKKIFELFEKNNFIKIKRGE